MNQKDYQAYWEKNGDTLYTYSPETVSKPNLNPNTLIFLTTWGLPSAAAPMVSFGELEDNILTSPDQIFNIAAPQLAQYLMFGSDGCGNPICLDTASNDEVVYLNHDHNFEPTHVNNSVEQLGLCLISYREFIMSLLIPGDPDYNSRKFTEDEIINLAGSLTQIDARCLDAQTFWAHELASLIWENENG